jgi:hypothetical protein
VLAGLVGLAGPAGLAGCSVEGVDETGTPLSVTGGALAVLASDHVDLRLRSVGVPGARDDGCPAGHRLVRADAEFEGSHVALDLEVGGCRGSRRPGYVCEGDDLPFGQHGVETSLAGCVRDDLDGGRVLYAGTYAGRHGPVREIAVLYGRGLRYTVTTEAGGDVRGYQLAEVAQDPRVGATVDAAYVVAGRDLPARRGG